MLDEENLVKIKNYLEKYIKLERNNIIKEALEEIKNRGIIKEKIRQVCNNIFEEEENLFGSNFLIYFNCSKIKIIMLNNIKEENLILKIKLNIDIHKINYDIKDVFLKNKFYIDNINLEEKFKNLEEEKNYYITQIEQYKKNINTDNILLKENKRLEKIIYELAKNVEDFYPIYIKKYDDIKKFKEDLENNLMTYKKNINIDLDILENNSISKTNEINKLNNEIKNYINENKKLKNKIKEIEINYLDKDSILNILEKNKTVEKYESNEFLELNKKYFELIKKYDDLFENNDNLNYEFKLLENKNDEFKLLENKKDELLKIKNDKIIKLNKNIDNLKKRNDNLQEDLNKYKDQEFLNIQSNKYNELIKEYDNKLLLTLKYLKKYEDIKFYFEKNKKLEEKLKYAEEELKSYTFDFNNKIE